ncbi:mitochondrial 54S ribosomal bL28m domain-containing protein [Alternaria dauci]|uniref:Uncharacterized protein n=1 Tax=Alternaria dauci TaxID=48095 RepID=A0ABR3U892_9PLEO
MPPRCQLLSGRIPTQGLALRPARPTHRTYATSEEPAPAVKNPLQRRRGGDLGSHLPKNVIPKDAYIPAYPYGDHQLFKQANKGLYGEQMIRFGNNVSKDTETKTRRNWKPNVLSKSLYSVALKKRIKLRITAKVLKTMDREGGLDEYLLKDNVARIKELGPMGWALRWTLMQKPEVIERLRAEAAALGLDQATIDKQWPTPEMQAEQRAAQGTLVRNVNSGEPVNLEFAETEGQEMWSGEEAEDPTTLRNRERWVESQAAIEYIKATKAADRYLSRGVVDSVEEGLKLAFIRAKEREEAAALLKHKSTRKVQEANFTKADLQEIRTRFNLPNIKDHTARKIAYNQRKRKMIDEAGGIEAWNAAKAAAHNARVAEAGGEEAFLAARKAQYAALIAEAETASTNEALDPKRRTYYEIAIERADRAIKAKAGSGQDDYVESTMEEFRKRRGGGGLSDIYRAAQGERSAGGDAWGALVNSSKKLADDRPRV